nr:immunoglobulin light chain junction region [Macaca mulatta]MOW59124.1 immunoglobulin light chain junction region [Macaca mulatta]
DYYCYSTDTSSNHGLF